MKISNTVFISCTKTNKENSTILEESIQALPLDISTELFMFRDNKESLSKMYNRFIDENISYYEKDTAIVFIHDDVYINCSDINHRLEEGLNQYDVVGLAGATRAEIKPPGLWHLMCDKIYHRGAVAHSISKNTIKPNYITSFGPMPDRVLLIDGLFIATTPKVLKNTKFNEANPSRFHYYDLDFSLECNENKYKIGVCDIPVIHMSPGLSKTDGEWEKGRDWFLSKWG
jgi:hypothetical protein